MWFQEHTALTAACGYIVVLGALAVLAARNCVASKTSIAHRRLADTSAVYAIGALLWPLIWSLVCGSAFEKMKRVALVGLIWPPLLLLIDTVFVHHQVSADPRRTAGSIQFDGNALSGMALAIGGLLARYVSGGYAAAASPMFMATILLIFMVVLPTPAFSPESTEAGIVQSVQKVALQYCLGFILTAVSVVLAVGLARGDAQGEELAKAMNESGGAKD